MPADPAAIASPPLGRRERNKQRVKERIYTAAISLFTEKGVDRTTIEDIAERADVARGTFVNHFKHKEELITTWSKQRQARFEAKLGKRQDDGIDVACSLRSCIAALAEVNEEDRQVNGIMLIAWVRAGLPVSESPHTADLFADVIRSGIESGQIAPDVNAMQVGHLLRDAYLGVLFRWCRDGIPEDVKASLTAELNRILDIVLLGILESAQREG